MTSCRSASHQTHPHSSHLTGLEVVPTYQVKIEIELPDEDAADAAAVKHSPFLIEVLDLSKMPHGAHVFL